MDKKVSLSIQNSSDAADTHHLPYTIQVELEITRKYKALLEHIHNNSELYKSQIAQNMVLEYAQSRFDKATIDNVFNSVEPRFTHDYFDEERQIARYRNCLSSGEIDDISHSVQSDYKAALSIYTMGAIRKVTTLCSEDYYDSLEGFFPFEFYEIDGGYIEEVPFSANQQQPICDADGHHTRQLTILINVGTSVLNFTPVSSDNEISMNPGDALLYPSNYSCSYYLKSGPTDGMIMRLYRLSMDDPQ